MTVTRIMAALSRLYGGMEYVYEAAGGIISTTMGIIMRDVERTQVNPVIFFLIFLRTQEKNAKTQIRNNIHDITHHPSIN
jgi:hypothetical protein